LRIKKMAVGFQHFGGGISKKGVGLIEDKSLFPASRPGLFNHGPSGFNSSAEGVAGNSPGSKPGEPETKRNNPRRGGTSVARTRHYIP
jgi:hypothetical protein